MNDKILIRLMFLFFIFLASDSVAEENSKYFTKRFVEIEWDEVPYALLYQLQIYDGKSKKFIKTFESETNVFRLNVKMGRYYFRSRIKDQFERISEWTELSELTISPPATQVRSTWPSSEPVYADRTKGTYSIPVAWTPQPGVDTYKISLLSPTGEIEKEIIQTGSFANIEVRPGQYQMKIQALLSDGTLGEPSALTAVMSVVGAKIQPPALSFERSAEKGQALSLWSELAQAEFDGEVYYQALEGKEWQKFETIRDLKERMILFEGTRYKPGRYRFKLQAKYKGFSPSEFTQYDFLVKPSLKSLDEIYKGERILDLAH